MSLTYLTKALQLAELRRGFCAPNPAVGAILLTSDQIVFKGYHWGSGHPHAEAIALNKAGAAARGASLYVTLEPCCHSTKKTPPCTDLLIQHGIAKLVYGFRDPNPAVSGQSERILREAGIECQYQPLSEISAFYQSYQFWWQHQQPFVTAKLAISLDGKIAGPAGQPVNLTGKATQHFTHLQRKRSDAILTTVKTICQDDPLLNVRLATATYQKPLYIIDRQLQLPLKARIFTTAARITVFHQSDVATEQRLRLTQHGVRCVTVPQDANGLDWKALLTFIGQEGQHDLWVEAGGTCFASLSKARLLQRGLIYVAPICLGPTAQSAFFTSETFWMAQRTQWSILEPDAICELTY